MSNGRGLGLVPRVTLLLLVFMVVPLTAGLAVTVVRARVLAEHQAHALLGARADEIASTLDTLNGSSLALARVAARDLAVQGLVGGSGTVADANAALARTRLLVPSIISMTVVDGNARVIAATADGLIGLDLTTRAHVRRALRGVDAIGDVRTAVHLPGQPDVISYTVPIDRAGSAASVSGVGGALLVTLNAETLWGSIRKSNGRAGADSYSLVTDEHGIRIAHSLRADHVYRPTGPLSDAVRAEAMASLRFGARTEALLAAVIDEPREYARAIAPQPVDDVVYRYVSAANGVPSLSVARRLQTAPWTVFVHVPEESVYGPIDDLWTGAVGIGLLLALLGTAFAFHVARALTERLRTIAATAQRLGRGDLSARVSGPTSSSTEITALMRDLNAMADALVASRATLEDRVAERTAALRRANEDLATQQAELEAQADELQSRQKELARKNDDVERADRMKTEFLANMSHELRTPLNSVIGFTDLVLDDDDTRVADRHRSYLAEVAASGRHLLQLVNEILDLSKIESGHVSLEQRAVVAVDVVSDARESIGAQARARGVTLVVNNETTAVIAADPTRLRQVLLNLLSNALKMSPERGTVTVHIEDDRAFVRFTVDDEGPGVPPELLPRLFTPFVQGESALTRSQQGTGLGLVISRRLVELHGGTIGVDSAPGGGARFWFTIPRASVDADDDRRVPLVAHRARHDVERETLVDVADPTRAANQPTTSSTTARPPARRSILIVDDNAQNRELLEAFLGPVLAEADLDVVVAADGAAALDVVAGIVPALVLLDIAMPGLDGFAVLRRMRADPRLARTPVIAVTALAMAGDEERVRSAGFSDYFRKPLDRQRMLAMVRSHLLAPRAASTDR